MVTALIWIGAAIAFSGIFVLVAKSLYRVVPVNEAHIRIMMNKKSVFSSRETKDDKGVTAKGKSAYWYIPIITKLHKLPLKNLAIPVNDVKLNDKDMAKFVCDIVCFVNINNINLAVERLSLTDVGSELGFDVQLLRSDLIAILESIGRTVATKQTILDIYMDRESLDQAITKEVENVFPKWGLKLVDLELKDIKDASDSTIIRDIERKVAAEKRRDAEIKEATMERESKVKQAAEMEAFRKREVDRDKEIGLAEQHALLEVAKKKALANEQEVEALRKLEVGKATVKKQMIEQDALAEKIRLATEAEGQKIKLTEEAEGKAQEIHRQGKAEADIILAKKLAEAEGTEKLALALQLYNDEALRPKMLDIMSDIQIAKFKAMADALTQADIRLIMSGEKSGSLFGLNFDAETGANFDQFMDETGLSGIDPSKLKEFASKVKDFLPTSKTDQGNGGA